MGIDIKDGAAAPPVQVEATVKAAVTKMETVDEMKSMQFQMHKKGFTVGSIVFKRDCKAVVRYKIDATTHDSAIGTRVPWLSNDEPAPRVEVAWADLLSGYSISHASVRADLQGYSPDALVYYSPSEKSWWNVSWTLSVCGIALKKLHAAHEANARTSCRLLEKPYGVLAAKDIEAMTLTLVPITTRMDVEKTGSTNKWKCWVAKDGVASATPDPAYPTLDVFQQLSPPLDANGAVNPHGWICPLWFVQPSNDKRCANMVFGTAEAPLVDGKRVVFTVMRNATAVNKLTEMHYFVQKDAVHLAPTLPAAAAAPTAPTTSTAPSFSVGRVAAAKPKAKTAAAGKRKRA